MKITWLGQAGLLFEGAYTTILVDPYLSDSCLALNPLNRRRVPVEEKFLRIRPDVIVLTHDHLDHTDPETLQHYLSGNEGVLVLAPENAWQHIRGIWPGHNYVMFNRHTQWTHQDIRFTAVKAQHSDNRAIGVIIEHRGKTWYITGDTLYHTGIFADLPPEIDVVFLPVNGTGNNLNMADAARFAAQTGARQVVPVHFGLFDSLNPAREFPCPNVVIPKIYEEIAL